MFSRKFSLKNEEIDEIIKRGKSFNSPFFLLRYIQKSSNLSLKIAFIAPKKAFNKAVLRSKVRRRLRGAMESVFKELNINPKNTLKGLELVFLGNKSSEKVDFKELREGIKHVLIKAGIIH